jgi:RNA polymerase sigma-70 factor (ECF subfamily)
VHLRADPTIAPRAYNRKSSHDPPNLEDMDNQIEADELTSHADALYSYALVLTRDPAHASDLVQETYMRALRALHRLREGSNMRGWLITILRNLWLNHLRSRSKAPRMLYLDSDEGKNVAAIDASDPFSLHTARIDAERVHRALEVLPVTYREIILLREFEELSYQEIAEIIKRPLGTVMSRLSRARSHLRGLLAPEPPALPLGQGKMSLDEPPASEGRISGKAIPSRETANRRKHSPRTQKTQAAVALAIS